MQVREENHHKQDIGRANLLAVVEGTNISPTMAGPRRVASRDSD